MPPLNPSPNRLDEVIRELRQLRRGSALAHPGSVLGLSAHLRGSITAGLGPYHSAADEAADLVGSIKSAIAKLQANERVYAEVDFNLHSEHEYSTLTERQESLASALMCAAKTVRRHSEKALTTLALLLTASRKNVANTEKLNSSDGASLDSSPPDGWRHPVQKFWTALPGSRIDVVCSEIPEDERPPFASPEDRNYLRYAKFADLDSLIYIKTRLTQTCPDINIRDFSPSEYWESDPDTLVVVGGPPWNAKYREFVPQLPYYFEPHPLGEDDPLVIPAIGKKLGPNWTEAKGLLDDVAVFTRLSLAQGTTVFLIAGCLTLGVLGAAKCFLQGEHGARNVRYIDDVVKDQDFVLVTRVHRVGGIPTMADLESSGPLVLLTRNGANQFNVSIDNTVAQ